MILTRSEHIETFRSLSEWEAWRGRHKPSQSDIEAIGARIIANGFKEPLTGRVAPKGVVTVRNGNWREGLVYQGISSRVRATMLVMDELLPAANRHAVKIYAAEAVTAFALRMRGLFPKFIGSEYAETAEQRRALFPVPAEDLTKLSFESGVFDFVSTNEVLEHVPDIDKSLSELARILKPGGYHVGTHPFLYGKEESQVKARLVGGDVEYLTEPEYHGNPVSSEGSLVFELPAWDIIERCRRAGFSRAEMRYVLSEERGILAGGAGGVFVLVAQK